MAPEWLLKIINGLWQDSVTQIRHDSRNVIPQYKKMTESWPIEDVQVASEALSSLSRPFEVRTFVSPFVPGLSYPHALAVSLQPADWRSALNSRGKNVVVQTDRHTKQQNETRTREGSDVIDIFAEKRLEIWPWF